MTRQPHHLEPTAEIFPNRLRGTGASITFLSLLHLAGNALTFWIYALLALVTLVFVWFIVPETKGKTLEQIEAYWHNGRHWVAAPSAEKPAEPTGVAGR